MEAWKIKGKIEAKVGMEEPKRQTLNKTKATTITRKRHRRQ